MPAFSERHGYNQPKGITFRDELPVKLRIPIFEILERSVPSDFLWKRIEKLFNPYGTDDDYDDWVETQAITAGDERAALQPGAPGEDDNQRVRAVLLTCPWFRVYDVIEDIFGQLVFYETESNDPDEEPRALPFQRDINDYFKHVGIGWQLVEGKIVKRGDEIFEDTVKTAVAVWKRMQSQPPPDIYSSLSAHFLPGQSPTQVVQLHMRQARSSACWARSPAKRKR